MIDLAIAIAALLACGSCCYLWGYHSASSGLDSALVYLRSDNTRLRSQLAACQRELDAEQRRKAVRIVSRYRGGESA